ncbi:hypothetical protein lerEdw1_006125 [Lerista edwardsae]|nr:hypothetical protein lerEdw1_006125 [Lerista edwardsae]
MSQEFNLSFLKGLEREIVLKVLHRDQMLRMVDEERIGDVKVKAGEWFFEERAKKFPTEGGRETAGAKLLESYQDLSDIWVVPPTPPPTSEDRDGVQTLVKNASSLHRLISGEQNGNGIASRSDSGEEIIPSNPISDTFSARHGSSCSIDSTCTEDGDFETADVSGEIEVAIRYRFKLGILEVHINACKNLAYGEEKKKKSNPYVKTRLLPDKSFQSKQKTSVRKNTVDPVFEETLKFETEYSHLETRQLHISVWHCGTFRRRVFLGEVIISFECWDFEDNLTQSFCWYQLRAKAEKSEEDTIPHSGELLVRAKLVSPSLCNKFQDEEQMKEKAKPRIEKGAHTVYQLHLLVLGVKNLPMIKPEGQLNSFVKSCLCIRGQRDLKQKTPVLKKQTQPQWKHLFVFNGVTTSQLRQSCLDLTLWDQSLFGLRDQFLGGARLGTTAPTSTLDTHPQANLQWEKMLSSPDTWTDIMLTLYPNAHAFKF